MPIEVEGPDGTVVEFPDNTPRATIQSVMARQYPKPAAGQRAPAQSADKLPAWMGGGRAQAPRKPAPNPTVGQSLSDSVAAVGGAMFRGFAAFPDMLADAGDAVTRGATSVVSGGLRAVGAGGAADFIERGSPGSKQQFRVGQIPDRLGTPRVAAPGMELAANIFGGSVIPIGPSAPRAAPRFPTRPSTPRYVPGVNADVVEAGARLNVPVRAPDAIPRVRGQMAKIEASPYGGGKIVDALDADKALMQTRLGEVGGAGAPHQSGYGFGEQIQSAGRRFIENSGETKGALYKRAESRAGGARVVPEGAIARVDANIAELEGAGANSNSTVINYLRGLRDDLSKPGGFSITEFQGLRSANSAKIRGDNALTMSDASRRLGDVVGAFTDDASRQLPEPAVGALRTADKYYKGRQDYINGVLKKFMGGRNTPLAPERAAERMSSMAMSRADYDALSGFMAKAEPGERADIAATFAEQLGKGRNGEFGLGSLATNIDKMPANVRTLVFGKDGASALEDLRVLARAKSDTAGGLNNSRSGVVMARQIGTRLASSATAGGVLGGWAGAVLGPVITETAAVIGQRRAANLLLNPQFTKVLRSVGTNPNPAATKVLITRLANLAGRNPAIAEEVAAFAQALTTKVPMQAAAEPGLTGTVTDTGDYSAY